MASGASSGSENGDDQFAPGPSLVPRRTRSRPAGPRSCCRPRADRDPMPHDRPDRDGEPRGRAGAGQIPARTDRLLRYQSGFVGAPPFDATTTYRSPSRKDASGFVRRIPVLDPVCVRSRSGCRAKALTLPSLARNSSMTPRFQSDIRPTSIQLPYGTT
jgi:hypothetical protein